MRSLLWLACLWPGLPQAWLLASGRGLLMAAGFAAALNLALLATFAWPQWPAAFPPGTTAAAAWLLVLGLWGAGAIRLRADWPRLARRSPKENDPEVEARFAAAQTEYVRGHWIEAETLVRQILARQPGDVESRLLLASIQRRTGRMGEAEKTLRDLMESDGAARWSLEIESELSRIANRTGLSTRPERNAEDGSGDPSYRDDGSGDPSYRDDGSGDPSYDEGTAERRRAA